MRRVLRWLAYLLGGVAASAAVAALGVYVASERVLGRTYPPPAEARALALPEGPAAVAEGKRLATVRGCYGGCHGMGLEGEVFFDEPGVARLVAPNLTAAARRYSDAELERIIRHGMRPDGRSVFGMPSGMFQALSDEDLAHILTFLRSEPAVRGLDPRLDVGPLGRVGLVLGQFQPAAQVARQQAVPAPAATPSAGDSLALGRYLALTSCTECHGADLLGRDGTPPLTVAVAYSPEELRSFFRTGAAKGGRELALMSDMARRRFSQLTDAEVRALHAYLRTLVPPPAS